MFGASVLPQGVQGEAGVFEHIVQQRDDLFVLAAHAQHEAQPVQDVGLAGFVDLAVVVGLRDERDGLVEQRVFRQAICCG
jgi:hypothetical protein